MPPQSQLEQLVQKPQQLVLQLALMMELNL
jgi:hypothetical protein